MPPKRTTRAPSERARDLSKTTRGNDEDGPNWPHGRVTEVDDEVELVDDHPLTEEEAHREESLGSTIETPSNSVFATTGRNTPLDRDFGAEKVQEMNIQIELKLARRHSSLTHSSMVSSEDNRRFDSATVTAAAVTSAAVTAADGLSGETISNPLAQTSGAEGAALCHRCRTVDFDKVWPSNPHMGDRLGRHKILKTLASNHGGDWAGLSCSLCQLLDAVKPKRNKHSFSKWKLLMLAAEADFFPHQLYGHCPAFGIDELPPYVLMVGQKVNRMMPEKQGYILPVDYTRKITARTLNLSVDYDLIRSWISSCQQHHEHTCATQATQKFAPFWIIDCERYTVVKARSGLIYTALSYVWGSSISVNFDPWQDPNLPADLPLTIRDAIRITKALGYSYLWVDRYCISQSNHTERNSQIKIMDYIYHDAIVVLIAAAGSDPTFGIPGVSSRKRFPQLTATIGRHVLVATRHRPSTAVADSDWDSRGWTYQEAICASRRLVFTEEQVYFECQIHTLWESAHWEPPLRWHNMGHADTRDELRIFPSLTHPQSWDSGGLWAHICRFAKRNLRYESDILNAMLGVFRMHERMENPVYHYGGLPIDIHKIADHQDFTKLSTTAFASALFWTFQPWEHGSRRAGFPSWSWTGWFGVPSPPRLGWDDLESIDKLWKVSVLCDIHDKPLAFEIFLEQQIKGTIHEYGNPGPSWYPYPNELYIDAPTLDLRMEYFLTKSDLETSGFRPWVRLNRGRDVLHRKVSLLSRSAFNAREFDLRRVLGLIAMPEEMDRPTIVLLRMVGRRTYEKIGYIADESRLEKPTSSFTCFDDSETVNKTAKVWKSSIVQRQFRLV